MKYHNLDTVRMFSSPENAEQRRTVTSPFGDELFVVRPEKYHGANPEALAADIVARLRSWAAMERALRWIPERYLEDMDKHTSAASAAIRHARKAMGWEPPPASHAEANAKAAATMGAAPLQQSQEILRYPEGHPLHGMTQAKWDRLPQGRRDIIRDNSGLSPQLVGLEGCRVEVIRVDGEKARFKVGKSTGWRPCHLEVHNSRSTGGGCADKAYTSVRVIRQKSR